MNFPVYVARNVSPAEFVAYWAPRYKYANESQYADNIGRALTATRLRTLFEWKNGSRLSARKHQSVERNYIARLDDLTGLPPLTSAEDFLSRFSSGGAIWRIFLLHCYQPTRFPIYDQHVHRAMMYIEEQRVQEIPPRDREKVESYVRDYLPFHAHFQGIDSRSVDRALWSFGKLLKSIQPLVPE